jgi:hypothetical protein
VFGVSQVSADLQDSVSLAGGSTSSSIRTRDAGWAEAARRRLELPLLLFRPPRGMRWPAGGD